MNHPFTYVGCFINFEAFHATIGRIRKNPLEKDIQAPHVTIAYMPEKVEQSLFGRKVHITVVGYGNDGQNEGLKVRPESDDPVLQAMIDQIEVPHITIAVSSDGQPVNTKNLVFEEIEPIALEGTYGGYIKGRGVVLDGTSDE